MDVDAPPSAPVVSAGSSSLPWVEKYRPKVLGELISHDSIIATRTTHRSLPARSSPAQPGPPHAPLLYIVTKLMESGRLPHLLFYGPPGTGKTSTVLALARQLHGAQSSQLVLEVRR